MTAELSNEEKAQIAWRALSVLASGEPCVFGVDELRRRKLISHWNKEYLYYNELCKPSKVSRE